MKYIFASAVSIGLLFQHAIAKPKVVPLEFSRNSSPNLEKRGTVDVPLINNVVGYSANVSIGSPPQFTQLGIDTGSGDTWVFGPNACPKGSQCAPAFDDSKSSSAKIINKGGWSEIFGLGSAKGDLITDIFQTGGSNVNDLTIGVAQIVSDLTSGLLGLGRNSASDFPVILESLVKQGVINSHAFSVWLNDISEL